MRWAISIGPAGRQLLSSTDRTPRGGGRRVWLPRAPSSAFLLVLREAPLARGREWHYSLDAHPLAEVYREWLESFAAVLGGEPGAAEGEGGRGEGVRKASGSCSL